jgi:Uma2 family endonuclease
MSVMTSLLVPPGGWTVDDLPDVDFRYELVDGALLVTPPEAPRTARVASRLLLRLAPELGGDWDVLLGNGVFFDSRNYREPDLFVCRREAVDAGRVHARDLLLTVEVMSPSTVASDRIAKPAQYAAAGIPHYWRVEPDAPVLVTHALADGVYRETARYGDVVSIREPVRLELRIVDLLE